jgi:hypothetical protein
LRGLDENKEVVVKKEVGNYSDRLLLI